MPITLLRHLTDIYRYRREEISTEEMSNVSASVNIDKPNDWYIVHISANEASKRSGIWSTFIKKSKRNNLKMLQPSTK